jgi:cytochrome c biogenesis protein CcmG/thiol:disulfide interchange protein DsbE
MNESNTKEKNGSIWVRLLAWGLVAGLLLIVAVQLRASSLGVISQGEPAPVFSLTTFEGEVYGPEEMAGKVVLVNFWASWCKPCEQEAEELQTAWEMYQDRGDVLFLGVDYVDTEREALKYLERFGITYPNGPDLRTDIYRAFRARGVPETFFIDQQGRIAYVQIGPFETLEQITTIIDAILEP